jgi:hypothetical protein
MAAILVPAAPQATGISARILQVMAGRAITIPTGAIVPSATDCRRSLAMIMAIATVPATPVHPHHREAITRLHRRLHHPAAAPVAVAAVVAAAVVQAGLTVNTEL